MQRYIQPYIWLFALWLLLSVCPVSSAYAYDRIGQNASWGTSMYTGSTPTYSGSTTVSSAVAPSYQFRSTSSYQSVVGSTRVHELTNNKFVGASGGILRSGSNPWDDPGDDDDPVGQTPTLPLGEPLVLLLMAVLYAFRRKKAAC